MYYPGSSPFMHACSEVFRPVFRQVWPRRKDKQSCIKGSTHFVALSSLK